jgi:hypothetical protein
MKKCSYVKDINGSISKCNNKSDYLVTTVEGNKFHVCKNHISLARRMVAIKSITPINPLGAKFSKAQRKVMSQVMADANRARAGVESPSRRMRFNPSKK